MTIPSSDFEFFTYSAANDVPSIVLKNDSSWTYCGPLLNHANLPPDFTYWMSAAMEGSITDHFASFLSHVHRFLKEANMSHYWITVRANKATQDFDVPRWHTDRPFFDTETGTKVTWKLCTTLIGPGTLFQAKGSKARAVQKQARRAVKASKGYSHQCSVVRCLGCADMQQTVRATLARKLASEQVVQSDNGQFAFFRVGDDAGAIHSEPPIPCDRVFVNVVPGEEEDLKKFMSKWGMDYPR